MKFKFFIVIVLIFLSMQGCKKEDDKILIVYATGRDFVNKPFVDKDGWEITLTSVLLHIKDIEISDEVVIKIYDKFLIELKSIDYQNIKITEIGGYKPHKHRVISFSLKKTFDYDFPGYSFIIRGKAKKNNKEINFTIKLNEEVIWQAIDEEENKISKNQKEDIIQLNFYLEYIFGTKDGIKKKILIEEHDEEEVIEYDINENAVGFNYFLPFEKNGIIDVSQEELLKGDKNSYKKLMFALYNFAFVGETQARAVYVSSKF